MTTPQHDWNNAVSNLHPLYAAIQAAIDEHGWPDHVKHIGLSCPAMAEFRYAVTLGTFGNPIDDVTSVAATVPDAARQAGIKAGRRFEPLRFIPSFVKAA